MKLCQIFLFVISSVASKGPFLTGDSWSYEPNWSHDQRVKIQCEGKIFVVQRNVRPRPSVKGFLSSQCRRNDGAREVCGHGQPVSFLQCMKIKCCRWTFRGAICYRITTPETARPSPSHSEHPNYPWQANSIPTRTPSQADLHTYSANAGQWRSTIQPSTSQCVYSGARVECGYPGIDFRQCRARGCCWDSLTLGLNWCFSPRTVPTIPSPKPKKPFFPFQQHVSNIFSGKFGNKFAGAKTLVTSAFYQLPPTTTTTTQKPNIFYGNTASGRQLSAAEKQFLLQVNKEISQLGKSVTPPSPLYPAGGLNRRLSGVESFMSRQQLTTTTTVATTTTTRATPAPLNINDLFRFMLTPQSQALKQNFGEDLGRGGEQSSKFQQTIALLRLLHESKQSNNGPAPSISNLRRCEFEAPDSCCVANPNGSCCGYRHSTSLSGRPGPLPRVVGGTPAGNLRYSVAHLSKRPARQHFCGGTLLGREWVLTAAHCVLSYCKRFTRDLAVSLGKYRKSVFPPEYGQQDFDVIQVVCHPEQCKPEGKPRSSDVALLRLSRPAVYTAYVQPTLLPRPYETPLANRNCMALGWGNTKGSGFADVLKEVSVPAFSNEQCTHPDWRGCLVKSCMICAGDVNTDPCDGDSGGPLFCQRSSGLYVLHGIYSWGRCGASEKKPSIYTRSSHFIDWIHDVVQS